MVNRKTFRKVSSSPGREDKYVKKLHDSFPSDGEVPFLEKTGSVDSSGVVKTKTTYHSVPMDCGHFVNSHKQIGGNCKKGLIVCSRHYVWCPRNSELSSFRWDKAPKLRSCRWQCGLVNGWLRFSHWLLTPPSERRKENE